jgi:hypothetical protein
VRALPLLLALSAFAARAEPDCEEDFHVCKDDCVIEFGGSTQVKAKKSLEKCMHQCQDKETRCTELVMDTRSNNLEDGALDRTPSSRDVDEHGLPTRTSGSGREAVKPEKPDKVEKARPPEVESEKVERPEKEAPAKKDPAPEPAPKKDEAPVIRLEPKREKEDDLRDDKPRAEQKPAKVDKRDSPAPTRKPDEKPRPKKEDDDDLRNY